MKLKSNLLHLYAWEGMPNVKTEFNEELNKEEIWRCYVSSCRKILSGSSYVSIEYHSLPEQYWDLIIEADKNEKDIIVTFNDVTQEINVFKDFSDYHDWLIKEIKEIEI